MKYSGSSRFMDAFLLVAVVDVDNVDDVDDVDDVDLEARKLPMPARISR